MNHIEQEAEAQRMTALRSYHLLDPPSASPTPFPDDLEESSGQHTTNRQDAASLAPEIATTARTAVDAQIDAITRLAATIAGVPFASVNLIDEHHQHPLSTVGPLSSVDASPQPIPRTQSLCATHFTHQTPVHIPDLSRDPHYADHPYVDGRLATLRSYTSIPLISPDGHALGTLCTIEVVPRHLHEEQLARLSDLAGVLVALFERHRDAVANARLAAEAETQRALAQALMAQQQHRAQQLTQLARASSTLATADDPRTAICHAARQLADADGVYLLQPDGHGHLVSTAVVGFVRDSPSDLDSDPGLDLRLDLTQERGLPLSAFRSGKPQFVVDVATHPDADPVLIEISGTVSGAWQPIHLRGGTCTGVLGIIWRQRREELDATLAWTLHTLAREAAHTLERADLLAQLTDASERDSLTGVGNRRYWDQAAAREIDRAQRSGDPLTFALIDLDHFKAYNDAYGHLIGDDLLRAFATAAGAQLRPQDTIARWGGEEFALALPGCDLEAARDVVDRVRAVVPHDQTATVGLAQWTPGASAATVLARADGALYRGKHAGRNTTSTG